ncbi:MAG: hypothetical protein IPN89_16005 [Saprospiraceae bacterium]|nr:hypothetical protein [Saprospiraceae bacterium]
MMGAKMMGIEEFLKLGMDFPILDVRSPGEFNHAHIPGALSFPLFTDEERAVVGTLYKQESREVAIKKDWTTWSQDEENGRGCRDDNPKWN